MMDFLFYILAGAGVGLAVGLTGVGGGSLMTPLLILSGIPEKIAIGTDLLYAAVTKTGAMATHKRQGTIRWQLVFWLAAGSIPASIATNYVLRYIVPPDMDYTSQLSQALGFMLILTALVVFFRKRIQGEMDHQELKISWVHRNANIITLSSGVFLGVFVTLSSVGAGAFCAALLMWLYPRLPALHIVGTDVAHAVPLTLIAGLGHLWNSNVDFYLLAGLLLGSLPAVHFGSKAAAKVPNTILQPVLAVLLLIIGIKFAVFGGGSH
ncbi:sulfite exporter TauE/SafE family protein [Agarilytica rhodophyticola]|uniref:sulfite exporter TauE/SafE family protein n=1 Tax=Agarilytica rhodophyticola TaxID=1737490 RepID=UPI001FEB3A3C|nr:sulfite exporter TauE/SafE family protein [Agarilytica rhodophyticola]